MYAQLASLMKAFRENQTSELEISISERNIKGVTFPIIDKIYSLFEHWTKEKLMNYKGCFVVKDHFYANSVRSRVISEYCGDNEETQNITKTKIASMHTKCPERKHVEFNILLKDEIPLLDPISVNNVAINVRIQIIWEFDYKNVFRYFLKQVQTGKTVEDACDQEILYEIEIEINRDCDYFQKNSDEDMAKKLVEKALDLIGRKNPKTNEIELLTMDLFSNKNEKKRKFFVG